MTPPDLPLWQKLLLVAAAGAAGTLARFFVATGVQRYQPLDFPLGTLAVNALGCLLFGIVWSLAEGRMHISPTTRLIILVGFLGAFTTFSTFAFETAELLEHSRWLKAVGNVLVQNVVGVTLAAVGMAVGRWF